MNFKSPLFTTINFTKSNFYIIFSNSALNKKKALLSIETKIQ